MKKFFFLFLFALLDLATKAQETENLLDIAYFKESYIYATRIHDNDLFQFYVKHNSNDMIDLNGKTYAVYKISNLQTEKVFYYRQENKKIYRYDEVKGNDVLMFDFSLKAGDVFTTEQGITMIVEETGKIKEYMEYWTYGGDVVMLKLRGVDNPQTIDIWAEGVGSIYTGLLPADEMNGFYSFFVEICNMGVGSAVFPQNRNHYKSMTFEPNDYLGLDPDDIDNCDNMKKEVFYEFIGDTLHVYGYDELNCYVYIMQCYIQNNNIDTGYMPILPFGLDLKTCMSLKPFDVRIPGFEPGTYTITLFGEDPLTIVCQPSSVNSTKAESDNTSIFDLTGRRLNSVPQKGMYIQGGKKWMVK